MSNTNMSNTKLPLAVFLVLQIIACIIYPPAYFQRAPQAAVLPPALLILFAAAIVGLNSGALSAENARNSLVFIQGINIVVRMMTLFPNLRTPGGDWAWALLITQLVGIALSWYVMVAMEGMSMHGLLTKKNKQQKSRKVQAQDA